MFGFNKKAEVKEPAEEKTVEIQDPEVTEDVIPKVDDVKENLTPEEIELGIKHGVISKPEEKKEETIKIDDKKKPDDKKVEVKEDEKKKIVEGAEEELSPEEEHKRVTKYNANEKALYFQARRDRQKRQQATADAELSKIKTKVLADENASLKLQLEGNLPKPEKEKEDDTETDLANMKDDDILTVKNIKDILFQHQKITKEEQDKRVNARKAIDTALNQQEKEAKVIYNDYDDVVDLTTELLTNADTILKDNPLELKKAKILRSQFFQAASIASNPEALANLGYTAADVAYQLGLLHPKYKNGNSTSVTDQVNGIPDQNSDKANKALAHARPATSSAGLSGGSGKRTVSMDDLTAKDVVDWSPERYRKLPSHVKERIVRECS